jgi:hypothetical protein
MEMKKLVAIGIIFLFIGVAVAPSINSTVVKASNDNDLVEVTSQACGIQGFGNTTVKLTKEQYQNLEQYLVGFRASLNQTTTIEEEIPLFKESVVELNKFGLLPKGMSVERAQRLVLGIYAHPHYRRLLEKIQHTYGNNYSNYENYLCLIHGSTSRTTAQGPLVTVFRFASMNIFFLATNLAQYFINHNRSLLAQFFGIISVPFLISMFGIGAFLSGFNPFLVLSVVSYGLTFNFFWYGYYGNRPTHGTVYTNGVNGIKDWNGDFYGAILDPKYFQYFDQLLSFEYYPGILGFLGIMLTNRQTAGWASYYFGFGLGIKVAFSPPDTH